MRYRSIPYTILCASLHAVPLAACLHTSTPVDPEGVDYPDFDPATYEDAALAARDGGVAGFDGGQGARPGTPTTPGTDEAGVDAGRMTVDGGQRDANAGPVDAAEAGTGEPLDAGATGSSALRCTFSASTNASGKSEYNGKYGCAVWVGEESKHVIKAFLVASRVASRTNLPTYKSAVAGVTVDVVTGATLTQAVNHNYTWEAKDASGASLPDGTYTLNVETHSSSGVDFVSVPFVKGMPPIDLTGPSDGDIKSTAVHCE